MEILSSDSKILYSGKEDPMDHFVWDVSLDKIKQDIGYEPKVTIETAIKEMGEYFKQTL